MKAAGVVLAAGSSSRMGTPKQLLLVEGRPLLQHVVSQATRSRLDEVVVVLGAAAELIRAALDLGRARVVFNPDYASGMASSLRAGLGALDVEVSRAVVILGDQPSVSAELLDQLLDLQSASGLPAAALAYGSVLQPPVVLERVLWPEPGSLLGDVGLRELIRRRPELVAALPAASEQRRPVDIDTPEDFRRLTQPSSTA